MDDMNMTIEKILAERCREISLGIFDTELTIGDDRSLTTFSIIDKQYPFGHHLRIATVKLDGVLVKVRSDCPVATHYFNIARASELIALEDYLYRLCIVYCKHLRELANRHRRHRLLVLINDYENKLKYATSATGTFTTPPSAAAPPWDGSQDYFRRHLVEPTAQASCRSETL